MKSVPVIQDRIHGDNYRSTSAALQQRMDEPLGEQSTLSRQALAGLASKDCFRVQLASTVASAKQQHKQVGLLLLDMNNFNSVVNHFGPVIGEELWWQVASRVLDCLRDADTAARMTKDELLVLLPEVDGQQGVSELVVNLHRSLVASYAVGGYNITLTACIGAAVYPNEGSIHDDLVRHACMYLSPVHNRDSQCLLQHMALSPVVPAGGRLQSELTD